MVAPSWLSWLGEEVTRLMSSDIVSIEHSPDRGRRVDATAC